MHKLYIKNPKIKKDEKGSEQQYNWLRKVRNGAANSSIYGSERGLLKRQKKYSERELRGKQRRAAKKRKI